MKLENIRTELVTERIKEQTWDRMETQTRGINGIKEEVLVYNYAIPQKSPAEARRLRLVREFRQVERRERRLREEQGRREVVETRDYANEAMAYFINGLSKKTPFVLAEYEKKEEVKEKDKKKAGKKEEEKKEESKDKEKKEEKKDEKQVEMDQAIEADWGCLYPSLEIFSNNHKRNQMALLQATQVRIKEQFNR